MKKILVVDDEKPISDIISFNLENEGYAIEKAYDGEQALEVFEKSQPDLVILDLMLPKMDGLEVCREIRKQSAVPVIMLTAKDSEIDKVLGLELGADDYVTKPFSNRELIARVKANLRRNLVKEPEPQEVNKNEIVVGDLVIHYLARHTGQVMTREHLLETVWDYDYFGDVRTVDVTIRRLREKIEDIPSHPTYIVTRRGVGYLLKNPDQE